MNRVARIAAALIALHLVVRAVLAFGGYFYWDDLILIGRAGTQGLLSPSYLFDDHDGHVMPAAFLVSGAITRIAPFSWVLAAVSLVVMQLLASLALLRALWVILGWRPVLLIPLTFALFTPLALPGFAWWAAGLNTLPMQAALAWVVGEAVLLARTGSSRHAVVGVLVFLGGLLFFEKAAVIPFVAFAVVALLGYVTGTFSLRDVWRRGLRLWVGSLALLIAWIGVYLLVVDQKRWSFDVAMTWDLLSRSFTHGIVPGIVGGPWAWQRWAPASPWATPPVSVMVLGWVVLVVAVAVVLVRKTRIWPVLVVALGYAVACQIPIYLMRSSRFTALELAQTLRYLPDLVVVLALLAAVGFCAPNRESSRLLSASRTRTGVCVGVAVLFVASSLYSTFTFLKVWQDNPVPAYLNNARASLASTSSAAPLLDQEVDPLILQRVAAPENLASHMFALASPRPEFASATTDLRMFDRTGTLLPAKVTWVRTIVEGPAPKCGFLVQPDEPAVMPLDGPCCRPIGPPRSTTWPTVTAP
ncbi:membrane protein [Mycolicibacterium fortuitum]|uniref:Membrane protein n=1 Tax=Mycolicibacterium fortuitum TaxID=1766 RepID=A0A378UZA7_MYCFO|nr:membrane protein [Mycolicibacterium fortuitum]